MYYFPFEIFDCNQDGISKAANAAIFLSPPKEIEVEGTDQGGSWDFTRLGVNIKHPGDESICG